MVRKKKLELRQIVQGWWVLDKNVLFTQRKEALIGRDPLTKELLGKLMSYNPRENKPTKEETDELKQRIEKKWNVGIVETWAAQPHLHGDKFIKESPNSPLSPVTMRISDNEELTEKPLLIFNKTKGYPVSSVANLPFKYLLPIDPSEGNITIQIELNLINQNDAKGIKEAVWEIVKDHLKGRKKEMLWEPKELYFLYKCRPNTFDNYLRWYDLHVQEKLGFRPIAAWDNTKKTNPQRAERALKWLTHNKAKSLGHIREEDKIEKGVKKIYEMIHRTKYSRKAIEPVIEEYNCSHHGTGCLPSCTYYQEWLGRFNRLNPTK